MSFNVSILPKHAFLIARYVCLAGYGVIIGTPPAPPANNTIFVGTRKLEDFTMNGKIQEQICYPSASSNTGITNNMNAYYSVF